MSNDFDFHPWEERSGPNFWDVVCLVGAGFVLGVAVCLFFGLVVVAK